MAQPTRRGGSGPATRFDQMDRVFEERFPRHPRTVAEEQAALEHQQMGHVRDRLLRLAAAEGVDAGAVDVALREAADRFAGAPVRAFVPVLVERAVRDRLGLRRAAGPIGRRHPESDQEVGR